MSGSLTGSCRVIPMAWHSSDLRYWLGTLENCWRPMIMKDEDLSNQMSGYLMTSSKSWDLNGSGLKDCLTAGNNRGINNKARLKMAAPFVEKG